MTSPTSSENGNFPFKYIVSNSDGNSKKYETFFEVKWRARARARARVFFQEPPFTGSIRIDRLKLIRYHDDQRCDDAKIAGYHSN